VKNHTSAIAEHCDVLGVHLVAAGQHDLAEVLGGITEDEDAHKLDGVARRQHASGAVLLDDCSAWFVGKVLERFDGGDHTGVLLAPLDVAPGDPPEPLRLTDIDFTAGHPAD
jgi:flavin reductase (DIM6/NTAB) family NADH-FMN oxidoreductase RutF